MKKYMILIALLMGIILLAFEAVPHVRVAAQQPCGGPNQQKCPPKPGNPVDNGNPGPKNRKPTLVPSLVPSSTPTLVPQPYPYPYPYPYPNHKHDPSLTTDPAKNACVVFYQCWFFNWDPILILAGAGFIIFVFIVALVFFRGGFKLPHGGGDPPPPGPG